MSTKLKSKNDKNTLNCSVLQDNKVVFLIKNCIVYGQGSAMSNVAEQIYKYLKIRNK